MAKRSIDTFIFLGLVGVVIVSLAGTAIGVYGTEEDGIRHLNRYLARWSFFLFSMAFIASSWHRIYPSDVSKWLMAHRRQIGLGFAMSMLAHLGGIYWFLRDVPDVVIGPVSNIGGGLGYVLIALMAGTSNDRAVGALGRRNWKVLHWVGMYYVWVGFALTYVGRIRRDSGFVVLAGISFGLLVFRLLAKVRAGRSPGSLRPLSGNVPSN